MYPYGLWLVTVAWPVFTALMLHLLCRLLAEIDGAFNGSFGRVSAGTFSTMMLWLTWMLFSGSKATAAVILLMGAGLLAVNASIWTKTAPVATPAEDCPDWPDYCKSI